MQIAGLILVIFGGVLLFASALALSCISSDDESLGAEAFDSFVFGGVIGFFRDLVRGIAVGLRNRSSQAFPPLILFGVSVILVVVGGVLLMRSGS